MIAPYLMTAQVARVKHEHIWRIVHDATHLSISILLPDTDPPAVAWVLPNGQRIEGATLDADVPAGETLCLCDDFSRCGIDMSGCDPRATRTNCAEIPTVRANLSGVHRCGNYRDMRYNTPDYVLNDEGTQISVGVIHMRRVRSDMVMTVEDISRRKAATQNGTHVCIEIAHMPNFTGDLSDLNVKTQYFYRVPNSDYTGYVDIPDRADDMVHVMPRTIIHHTGVHGHCDLSSVLPGRFGFYGNPNMLPDDYDQICITLAACMQSLQDNGALTVLTIDPNDFVLDISARRTSASDAAVEQLRSLGMTVNEIDD
jgi:hypothetical protein